MTITGEDSAAARQRAADALQTDPAVRVLAGNLHAAGVGLTLTAATHVLFNDLDWVPGNHWQAEDRIYRIGQTRPAFVTYLYAAETLDDFVAALLEQKAANIGVLEAEAAEQASLVQQVVDAAARGERPARGAGGRERPGPPLAAALGGPAGGDARPAGPRPPGPRRPGAHDGGAPRRQQEQAGGVLHRHRLLRRGALRLPRLRLPGQLLPRPREIAARFGAGS